MGLSIWYFIRADVGDLRTLASTALTAFMDSEKSLPVNEDGFVRYVQVVVDLVDRRASEVLGIDFFQYRAREDGTLDEEHKLDVMRAAADATFPHGLFFPEDPGVVHAGQKFAKRRYDQLHRWEPTREEVEKLRGLINRRAGRKLI